MVLTIVGGLYFGMLNFTRGLYLAAILELAFVLGFAVALPTIVRTRHLRFWSLVIVIPWMAALLLLLSMQNTAESIFIWALILPLLLHFLLGERLGLVLSLVGLAGAAVVALIRFDAPQTPDQLAFASNIVLAGLVALLLAHVYERGRSRSLRAMKQMAATDSLTGLANRSLLYDDFEQLRLLGQRRDSPLSMLLIDLDHFKEINDRFGHAAGDRALVAVADFLRQRLRGSDRIYRMGGEEFLVLMPDTTRAHAAQVAESVRQGLARLQLTHDRQELPITASIGVAELGPDGSSLDPLLYRADKRLYWCKAQGRNRVQSDDPPE